MNDGNPYFLKVKGSPPIALFNGTFQSAAIDSEGGVIFIKKSFLTSPEIEVSANFLPDKERAVSVSFEREISVLGESGRLFTSSVQNDVLSFSECQQFSGKKVIDISGKYDHGFAVCDDGSVYARGSNYFGELGVGDQVRSSWNFIEIESLKKYKIVAAYAGSDHSLFQTENGMVLSCGNNDYGQLMLDKCSKEKIKLPVKTTIVKGATFCIAGYSTSAVFIGDQIPQYTPNKKVNWEDKNKDTSTHTKQKASLVSSSNKKSKSKNTFNLKSSKDFMNIIIGDDRIKTVKKIGEGATSIAYKVIDKETSQIMCKKVIKQVDDQDAFKKLQNSMKEISVLLSIDHPCICKAFGFDTQEKLENEDEKY